MTASNSSEELTIRRKLQLLKGGSGEYVIAPIADFPALVEFVLSEREQSRQQLLDELELVIRNEKRKVSKSSGVRINRLGGSPAKYKLLGSTGAYGNVLKLIAAKRSNLTKKGE